MPTIKDIEAKAQETDWVDLENAPDTFTGKITKLTETSKGWTIEFTTKEGIKLGNHYTLMFLRELTEAMRELEINHTRELENNNYVWSRESGGKKARGKITYFPRHYPVHKAP